MAISKKSRVKRRARRSPLRRINEAGTDEASIPARPQRFLTLDDLSTSPFCCVNCFELFRAPKAYCAQLCADEAAWVRYARRSRQDGRDTRPDIAQAIKIRLALILAGGYDKAGRKLSDAVRTAVLNRDGEKCRKCGEPAAEIDHIRGSSSALTNLQLLCDRCHNEKTVATFIRITEESHPEAWAKAESLRRRATALQPLQLCDADDWEMLQKELLRRRRNIVSGEPTLF